MEPIVPTIILNEQIATKSLDGQYIQTTLIEVESNLKRKGRIQ